jgi:hypothetical protein
LLGIEKRHDNAKRNIARDQINAVHCSDGISLRILLDFPLIRKVRAVSATIDRQILWFVRQMNFRYFFQ